MDFYDDRDIGTLETPIQPPEESPHGQLFEGDTISDANMQGPSHKHMTKRSRHRSATSVEKSSHEARNMRPYDRTRHTIPEEPPDTSKRNLKEIHRELGVITEKLKDENHILHDRLKSLKERERTLSISEENLKTLAAVLEVKQRVTNMEEKYRTEEARLEKSLKESVQENKRLKDIFDTFKMSGEVQKKEMESLKAHHDTLEKQSLIVQTRLTKLQLKQEPGLTIKEELNKNDPSAASATIKTEETSDEATPSPMGTIITSGSIPIPFPAPVKPKQKDVIKLDEPCQAQMPTSQKMNRQNPEYLTLRQPVDPVALQIPDFNLYNKCCPEDGHNHRMECLGLDLNNGTFSNDKDPMDKHSQPIQEYIQSFVHACRCTDTNCIIHMCKKMKRYVAHIKWCLKNANINCQFCRKLLVLSCYHSKQCSESKCQVPFCPQIKHKLRQQQLQNRPQQAQLMRRHTAIKRASVALIKPVSEAKSAEGPPPGTMQDRLESKEAVHRQAGSGHCKPSVGSMPLQKDQIKPQFGNVGAISKPVISPQPMQQKRTRQGGIQQTVPQSMSTSIIQQNSPQSQADVAQMRHMQQMQLKRMPVQQNPGTVNMQPRVDINAAALYTYNRQTFQRPPGQGGPEWVDKLVRILKSPISPQRQQQRIKLNKSYPQIRAAVIAQRNFQGGPNPQFKQPRMNQTMQEMPKPQQQHQPPPRNQSPRLAPHQELLWQQRMRMQQHQRQQYQQQQLQQQPQRIGGQQQMVYFYNTSIIV